MSQERDEPSRFLRTEFLERIAHELRGPSGVTLGALDELEHALGPALVEENRLLFAMARRGARRVLRTAERLTRSAQLESDTAHITLALCDLRGVVQQAVKDAEQIEARTSVRLDLTLPDAPALSEVDSGWLTIALGELISQSIRSARQRVTVSVHAEERALIVRVADDRTSIMEAPPVRFVPLQDRRDSALGWPLICDVARAHDSELISQPLQDAAGKRSGLAVSLRLRAAD